MVRTVDRRNTAKEEGWLDAKFGADGPWERRWLVYEDSELRLGPSPTANPVEFVVVPMDRVVSVRTKTDVCGIYS